MQCNKVGPLPPLASNSVQRFNDGENEHVFALMHAYISLFINLSHYPSHPPSRSLTPNMK